VNLLLTENFKWSSRVRQIWQNPLKTENKKFTIYGRRNSKSIVGMDSYHRRTFFQCIPYFNLKHGYIDYSLGEHQVRL
jgi:hypothetical protein